MATGHQVQDSGLMVYDHLVHFHEVAQHQRAWIAILRDMAVMFLSREILDKKNLIRRVKNLIPDIHEQKGHKGLLGLKCLINEYLIPMNMKVLAPGALPIQMTSTFTHQSQMISIREEFIRTSLIRVVAVPLMYLIQGDHREMGLILGCHIRKTLILEVLDRMVLIAGDVRQDQISFLLAVSLAQEE
jgi:hypothetical protein